MTQTYDLVVRDGLIYDGSGGEPVQGDVAVAGDRIAAVGRVEGHGRQELDAGGRLVTPGFVDVHTHYDGQAIWEQHMSPSSNHGVTSAVVGNCGVGFAPCRPDEHDLLVTLMEGVEDVPEVVMTEGLAWNWETFPEYLDALSARRLDLDIAAQVPHSALRVYVMGERGARKEPPDANDLQQMRDLTTEAVTAGAIGVSTSRNIIHRTAAGDRAPSLFSEERELLALAQGLKAAGAGVFQIIPNMLGDPESEFALMRRLAVASGRPLSFSLLQVGNGPEGWRTYLRGLEEAAAEGLAMRAQVFPRPVGFLYGLDLSFHPFALHPSFRPLRDLPLAEKVRAMRDPDLRERLLSERPEHTNPVWLHMVDDFLNAYLMGDPPEYEPDPANQIQRLAAAAGQTPHQFIYDRLIENEGRTIIFQPAANYADGNLDAARAMVGHPRTVIGLGDGGAHYGTICDASYPTFLLERWVRDAPEGKGMELSTAIRSLTQDPALAVGMHDRGLLAAGYLADLNIIDLEALTLHAPTVAHDLPAGGRRLRQEADGYVATVKSGEVTFRDGQATGALPGRLVRSGQLAGVGA